MLLNPRTIRSWSGLGKNCIAVQTLDMKPHKLWSIFIDGAAAYGATSNNVDTTPRKWTVLSKVAEDAIDVALELDGAWHKDHVTGKVKLITEDYPWIFWVTSTGVLMAQYYNGVAEAFELATGVTKVAAVKGWSNDVFDAQDQGVIVTYIKDGAVCYRTYAVQSDLNKQWEIERTVTGLETGIAEISLFRGNDYRVIFLAATTGGSLLMVPTKRQYSGLGAADESVLGTPDMQISITAVSVYDTYNDESAVGTPSVLMELIYTLGDNDFVTLENIDNGSGDYGILIAVTTISKMTSLSYTDFTVKDSEDTNFPVGDISWDGVVVPEGYGNRYVLTVNNFNNAVGDITVSFLGSGSTKGADGQDMSAFDGVFTPTNLVPSAIDPPVVITIFNV